MTALHKCHHFSGYSPPFHAHCVINCLPKPKIVRLERWEERKLFSDGLDEGF